MEIETEEYGEGYVPFETIPLEEREYPDPEVKKHDILETYAHRVENKVHLTYPPGACGDMLAAIFFIAHFSQFDLYDTLRVFPNDDGMEVSFYAEHSGLRTDVAISQITKAGKVINHFTDRGDMAFKTVSDNSNHYYSRDDLIKQVYQSINGNDLYDKVDRVTEDNVDTVGPPYLISHLIATNSFTLSTFDQLNNTIIALMPTHDNVHIFQRMLNKKDNNPLTLNVDFMLEALPDNAIVINPIDLITTSERFENVVDTIMSYIPNMGDKETVKRLMMTYHSFWLGKQDPKILTMANLLTIL